jgi:hypothetical protein
MDIDVFPASELPVVIRTLRTALRPAGALDSSERTFLETYSRISGYAWQEGTDPAAISPRDVQVEGSHPRKRLIQLASLAVLFTHPVRPESVRFVKELGKALGVFDPVLSVLDALARRNRFKARLLTARRGLRAMLKEAYLAEGGMGVFRFVVSMAFRAAVNRDKMWKYKKLGLLPQGSLGRSYWEHLTSLGYGFPGEPAGIPETVAYHDVGHVLTGYDTTPAGEIQQGCFQGGNRREDGFFFIQFAVLQFHQGLRLTPVAQPETGYFHPVKVLWAIHRGASCNVDITHQWNYWPLMPLPLSEARESCGLLPPLLA